MVFRLIKHVTAHLNDLKFNWILPEKSIKRCAALQLWSGDTLDTMFGPSPNERKVYWWLNSPDKLRLSPV